uniref:FLYWCH-type domain-containing protein n=1 Tax=Anopheles melas TaxID=34690 RepID=A0A182U1V5_9DIPT
MHSMKPELTSASNRKLKNTPTDDDEEDEKIGIEHKFALDLRLETGSKGRPKLIMGGYAFFRNNSSNNKTYWLCSKNHRKIQQPDPITLYRPRLTFIQGQREHKLLVIGGYTYARNNFAGDDTIYWACRTSYKHVRCSSRVVTTLLDDGMYRITITNPKHNHPRPRRQRGNKKHDQTKWLKIDLSPILQKPSEPVVLVPCRLGGMKVFYQGYYFEYHTSKSGIKHYRCVHHAQHDCKARIIVKASRVYEFVPMHNHPHDDDA